MTLWGSVHFFWWDKSDISPGADKIVSARPAARVKAGTWPPRSAGLPCRAQIAAR
jgi:hypothetical protein